MASPPNNLLHYIRHLAGVWRDESCPDAELLERFTAHRDENAFTTLVGRHGGTVWAVCRNVLGDGPDVEDAFQATFLALARHAGGLRKAPLAGWLARVAHNVAVTARRAAARCERKHDQLRREVTRRAEERADPDADPRSAHLAVQEELDRLPGKFRLPVVLYYQRGHTQVQVSEILGLTERTVRKRLVRAVDLLRQRLASRGVCVSGSVLVGLLGPAALNAAAVSATLAHRTVEAALAFVDGSAVPAAQAASEPAAHLAMEVTKMTSRLPLKLYGLLLVAVVGAATGVVCLQLGWAAGLDPTAPLAANRFAAAPVPAEGADLFKDPLPEGAVARIGTLRFWPEGGATDVAHPDDWRTPITVDGKGKLTFWTAGGRVDARVDGPDRARWVCLSPDGKRLAVAGSSEVWVWELEPAGRRLRWIWAADTTGADPAVQCELTSLAFTPDGKAVVCGDAWAGKTQLLDPDTGKSLKTLDGVAWSPLCFSADSKTLAAALQPTPVSFKRPQAGVWDVKTGRQKTLDYPGEEAINDLDLSADGKRLVWAGEDSTVRICDPATGKELVNWPAHSPSPLVVFSPDGRTVAEFGWGQIHYRDSGTGAEARRPAPIPNAWFNMTGRRGAKRVSADGKHVALAGGGVVIPFEVATGKEVAPAGRLHDHPRSLAFSPDGKRLVSLSGWGTVQTWDAATGRPEKRLSFDRSTTVMDVREFGPDGRVQVTQAHPPGEKWLWEKAAIWLSWWDGQAPTVTEKELPHHSKGPFATSLDGRLTARLAGGDGTDVVLAEAGGKELHKLKSVAGQVATGLTFSADGRTLLAYTSGSVVETWDTGTGRARCEQPLEVPGCCEMPVLSADGRWMAVTRMWTNDAPLIPGAPPAARHGFEVTVWDVVSGKAGQPLLTTEEFIYCVALSPDGRLLAVGQTDGSVVVMDVKAGREVRKFTGHRGAVRSLAFSPDGRRLASGSADCTALVWDVSGLLRPAAGAENPRK